jgi:hypothetical protein
MRIYWRIEIDTKTALPRFVTHVRTKSRSGRAEDVTGGGRGEGGRRRGKGKDEDEGEVFDLHQTVKNEFRLVCTATRFFFS